MVWSGAGKERPCAVTESITLNLRVLVSHSWLPESRGIPSGAGQPGPHPARPPAVVDAARALFLERGYQATTIDAISDHSDVPAATVYRLFSSKLGILKALLDVSIAGDDQALSLQERPQVAALFAEPTPRSSSPGSPASPSRSMRGAATSTASCRAHQARIRRRPYCSPTTSTARRRTGPDRTLARRAGALRPGLRERDAADLIHALMSPELYRLLVIDRGWPPERYEQWLARTLTDQLTSPTTATA